MGHFEDDQQRGERRAHDRIEACAHADGRKDDLVSRSERDP